MLTSEKADLGLPAQYAGMLWDYTAARQMHTPHHHVELELNLVTQGTAAYLLGDRRYELRRHSLVWLFPDQEHVLLDQSADYHMWIGVFTPQLLRQVCVTPAVQTLCLPEPEGWYCRPLAEPNAQRLEQLFGEIAGCREDLARHNAGLGYALLAAWTAYVQATEDAIGLDVHPAVERAVRLLRAPDAPETLERLAAQAGLSASRLSHLFRAQTGVSLAEFRNAQRLERFLRCYGQGRRLSVSEAALEAGFGSYPQFYRVFVQRMGYSPAEHRRRIEKASSGSGVNKTAWHYL